MKSECSTNKTLEEKILETYDLDEDNIVLAKSSINLLKELSNAKQLGTIGLYLPDYFEYTNMFSDVKLLNRDSNYEIDKVDKSVDSILISNPNNPTAKYIDLKNIVKETEKNNQYLVVDEAYIDYLGEEKSAVKYVKNRPHVIVIRSFSKLYGFTNEKVSYLVANKKITRLIKGQTPNGEALKKASKLYNCKEIKNLRVNMALRRNKLCHILKPIANDILESELNFVMARNSNCDLNKYLRRISVTVVGLNETPGLETKKYVRIGVGSYKELAELDRRIKNENLQNRYC